MSVARIILRGGVTAALLAAALTAPAGATTLIRQSLADLVVANRAVVVGEVLDVKSYWNDEGTFILSDVEFEAHQSLKGDGEPRRITLTVMGGTVGDLTTLIIGGPELVPGAFYVLFLNREDLPGAPGVETVRDLCQGVFDVEMTASGPRAISQANRHPLLPDKLGYLDAPGGLDGFPLDAMIHSIRELADRPSQGGGLEVQ